VLFDAKCAVALRLLVAKGIRRGQTPPLLYQLLWFCGIRVPLPHFAGFLFNLAFFASYLGLYFGLMALVFSLIWRVVYPPLIFWVIGGSALAGIVMAWDFRRVARKHRLPSWSELRDEAEIFD
jgi:hypothetical protein